MRTLSDGWARRSGRAITLGGGGDAGETAAGLADGALAISPQSSAR